MSWGVLPKRQVKESPIEQILPMLNVCVYKPLSMKSFHGVSGALHQKSGQYADPSVNKTFLASF